MFTVYKNDTGGSLDISCSAVPTSVSGHGYFIGYQQVGIIVYGTVESGILSISTSGLSVLNERRYIMLPRVIDDLGRVHTLQPQDVLIYEG